MRKDAHADGRDAISQLVFADAPVLIFEVDAAGVDRTAAPSRSCDVRLIGSRQRADGPQSGRGREMSAVLVLRSLTPSRLRSCVRAVAWGGSAMPAEVLCSILPERATDGELLRVGQLTDRELDVLRLLGEGENTREIAKQLSYSERTVKVIVHDLLAKLGCRTRAQAVAFAARHGVI